MNPEALRFRYDPASNLLPLELTEFSKRWEEFPNVTLTFDCTGRSIGFYADQEFNCQIFHLCDADGRRIPYICANETAFNQQYRVCDWAYNVNCEEASNWYYLNDLTYVTDPPKPKN
ncbi:unnamed protein product [Notodromas monacha]|uniref:Chitin-binding type-2 domain-containing protein n=1 Tax=Notodromas monacha TaxID=399045 RepID=A0A7R9BTH4_9CRUS|nr:unnamed protein product [Notodromas monacha]CAG0920391.1 unnamed protein product [Notodromas monacha]